MRRLEQLQSFEKVYAPFDGVITARNTDIGDLIDAGASTQPRQLFHMAAIRELRVYVPVPEVYAPAAHPGATTTLTLDEYPGETFHGKLVRTSDSIDISSRTLLVEVDVDNPAGKLLPGAYVFVHLKLPVETRSVTIPSNTLLFRREGLQVGVVRNGKAELVAVKIGRDYGSTVEILSGLQPSDAVILDPADSLVSGTAVQVNIPSDGGQTTMKNVAAVALLTSVMFMAGCTVGPKYVRPSVPATPAYKEAPPASFKEAGEWQPAQPGDQGLRGKWWEIFGDPGLNALEEQVTVSNQDLKAAEARFREARALVRFNRASEFPTISVGPSANYVKDSDNTPAFPAPVSRARCRGFHPSL